MFHQWQNEKQLPALRDLTEFRYTSLYRGTGFDMPDLRMGLGQVGMHFVLRELYRCGTLRIPGMERYCFVPSKQNLQYFGCDENLTGGDKSKYIFDRLSECLSDPTFGGQFDIAFEIIRQGKIL